MKEFDPTKVERFDCYAAQGEFFATPDADGEWVRTADYALLLLEWKAAQDFIEIFAKPAIQREYDRLPADVRNISEAAFQVFMEDLKKPKESAN